MSLPTENDSLDTIFQAAAAQIDENYAVEFMKQISLMGNDNNALGFATAGSSGEVKIANRIAEEMRNIGLSDVALEEFPVDAWEFTSASLTITSPFMADIPMTLSAYAGSVGLPTGIDAEIIDVGSGAVQEYKGKDVAGKIVLASFDFLKDYWVGPVAHQAELKGAAALIATYDGDSFGMRPDALNSFDGQLRPAIPVLNMSRKDAEHLKELLHKGPVTARLSAIINLALGQGKSHNVVGRIPGKNDSQYIIFASHYDGYFNAFVDNRFGVATTLALAKALLEAGYQPEKTLIFIAHGSEEYGVSASHYDWCIGSWHAVNTLHTEWAGNTFAILNTDAVRPDTPSFVCNATPELHSFMQQHMEELPSPPSPPYTKPSEIQGLNGPWSDDFNYAIKGIPAVLCGLGPSQWKQGSYHTQYDNYANEYMGTIPAIQKYCISNYIQMCMALDAMALAPIDLSSALLELPTTLIRETIAQSECSADDLMSSIAKAADEARNFYVLSMELNAMYNRISSMDAMLTDQQRDVFRKLKDSIADYNHNVLSAYKLLQGDMKKINRWDLVIFGHEMAQENYKNLSDAITALEASKPEQALQLMQTIDSTVLVPYFEKEVYEFSGLQVFDQQRSDLYWGTNKILPQLDTYDVYKAIEAKKAQGTTNYSAEIHELRKMLAFEAELLADTLLEETRLSEQIRALVDTNGLHEAIQLGKSMLV
ncbi:MAG: M28 family peptidase [Desulfovibrio sp.]|uniref:M28 family peptidase n=1 Tax=Desulfovibrio sp. 7SRBS1 TaxID=3378064 RepID=UPI003B3F35E1